MMTLTDFPTIHAFRGDYRFLSNFAPVPKLYVFDTYDHTEVQVPTVEHAFQALKTTDYDERQAVLACQTPGQAKRAGRRVTLRPRWDDIRLDVMHNLLRMKFDPAANPHLAAKLVDTEGFTLVEGNDWGDEFWGVCRGVGHNHLGRLLMDVRRELLA